MTLFDQPPAQRHSATSVAAAEEIKPSRKKMAEEVYEVIRQRGPITDERIADVLGMNPSTARPRRIELVRAGKIRAAGTLRTNAGRRATCWEVSR
jgi:predicted ArsR family transcriptional regulator